MLNVLIQKVCVCVCVFHKVKNIVIILFLLNLSAFTVYRILILIVAVITGPVGQPVKRKKKRRKIRKNPVESDGGVVWARKQMVASKIVKRSKYPKMEIAALNGVGGFAGQKKRRKFKKQKKSKVDREKVDKVRKSIFERRNIRSEKHQFILFCVFSACILL